MSIDRFGPAWAEVNLDRLKENLLTLKKIIKPQTKIMAVVKTNAYGHGAVETAIELVCSGVDQLAVSIVNEGIELRTASINVPILLLNPCSNNEFEKIIDFDLTPTVYSAEFARELALVAKEKQKKVNVHIRIDVGLGNLGIQPEELGEFLDSVKYLEWIHIDGIYTHLYAAYSNDSILIQKQIARFEEALALVKRKGINIPVVHAASSPAILSFPQTHYDMVRPGNILYGLPPERVPHLELTEDNIYEYKPQTEGTDSLFKPIMQLKSRVADIKTVSPGKLCGYNYFVNIKEPKVIATVTIGYADVASLVHLINGYVLIRGKKLCVFGNVTMDYFVVDITAFPEISVDDEVVIYGEQNGESLTAEELAAYSRIEKIDEESYLMVNKRASIASLCMLNKRVPRIYIKKDSISEASGSL